MIGIGCAVPLQLGCWCDHLQTEIRESLEMLHDVGGAEFVSMIVQMFLEETPQLFSGIREDLNAGNTEAAAMAAHKLVGSSRQFGMVSPHVPFEELELTAKVGDVPGALALVDASEAVFAEARPLLRRYLVPG